MNYRATYNNVVDDIRTIGFNRRTKWIRMKDGSVKGDGFTCHEDPNYIREAGTYGTCVKDNLITYIKLRKAGAKLIQGKCRSRIGEWASVDENRGMPIYHCWVELGDKVFDYSNGTKEVCDIDLFYLHRRVQKAEEINVKVVEKSRGELSVEMDEEQRQAFYKKIKKEQKKLGYNSK